MEVPFILLPELFHPGHAHDTKPRFNADRLAMFQTLGEDGLTLGDVSGGSSQSTLQDKATCHPHIFATQVLK